MVLAETQRLFWRLLVAPEGAASVDGDLRSAGESLVRGDARLAALDRVDIYANMYFYRLLDVLRTDYPALSAVIGDTAFHNLVTDYLAVFPPEHFSLRYAGSRLATLLEEHPVSTEFPYARDLARFEWAHHDAFDAVDDQPIGVQDLAAISPDHWPELVFGLTHSLVVLDLDWSVAPLADAVRDGSTLPDPLADPCSVRVWRQDGQVWHRTIARSEAKALRAIAAGATFDEICTEAAGAVESDAVSFVTSWLRTWIADGLLIAVKRKIRGGEGVEP